MANGESETYLQTPAKITQERDERLLNIVNNTGTMKLFDYISNVIINREIERGDDASTSILLEHLVEKRERVAEIESIKAMHKLPSGACAFEEEINEALFKPFGDK